MMPVFNKKGIKQGNREREKKNLWQDVLQECLALDSCDFLIIGWYCIIFYYSIILPVSKQQRLVSYGSSDHPNMEVPSQ